MTFVPNIGDIQVLEDILDALNRIANALTPTQPGPIPPEKINYYSWIVVPVGAATVPLSTGKLLCRLAICQNINNNATPPTTPITLSDVKNKVAAGTLNPPGTKNQAGGSWPLSAPAPDEYIDLSGIFATGSDASDRVAVGYV